MQPLKLLTRLPEKASLYSGPPSVQLSALDGVAASAAAFSPDGSRLVLVTADAVVLYNAETEQQVHALEVAGVVAVHWSPRGSYLQTFQRPSKEAGNAFKNLKIWNLETGEIAMQLFQRSYSADSWPAVQLSADESQAFHLVTNAINVYDPTDFASGIQTKLSLKGIGGIAVSPASPPLLAAFVPEAKGGPGFAAIYDPAQLTRAGDAPTAIARRSFFRASGVQLAWNATGSALLATTSSDVDATNQSYYGEQKLHFLSADGTLECLVPAKEGPIHDVRWSPKGDVFALIAGFMPAKTVIFDDKCKPIYDLGSGPHNLVRWNPQGRFFAVAGFGNLPGDVVFYDKKADGKCKEMGATRANNAVTAEWSPDGRYLLTATTAPRMRVDNGFQVFRYDGGLVHQEAKVLLLEATWRPAAPGVYPDRPQSPRAGSGAGASTSQAAAEKGTKYVKPVGYVPPHARGSGGAAGGEDNFSLAYDSAEFKGKLKEVFSRSGGVPGAAFTDTKAASKNAKRRAKKKGGGGGGDGADGAGDDAPCSRGMAELAIQNGSSLNPALPAPAAATNGSSGAPGSTAGGVGGGDAAEKRIKALQKKLRQIEQLKERLAKEGKAAMDSDQLKKIASEGEVTAEIRSLEASL